MKVVKVRVKVLPKIWIVRFVVWHVFRVENKGLFLRLL